jgi:exopolyphosphatase
MRSTAVALSSLLCQVSSPHHRYAQRIQPFARAWRDASDSVSGRKMTSTSKQSFGAGEGEWSSPLADFLLRVKNGPTSHVVIGNSAGDADSIVSALAHAYIRSVVNPQEEVEQESSRSGNPIESITPVVSITQADLEASRPETLLLLKWAGIAPSDLLYVDNAKVRAIATTATLVDHNHLQADNCFQHCRVIEIIDHHKDDGMHTDSCPVQRRRIAYAGGKVLVASTCTLLTESLIMMMNDPASSLKVAAPVPLPHDPSLAMLLLGVILLDSVNLQDEAGKVTDRDRAAVSFLVDQTDWTHSGLPASCRSNNNDHSTTPDLFKVFETLQQAKFDRDFWTALSIRDALRLDYKSFRDNTFGIASVLISWNDFKEKENLVAGLKHFVDETQTQLLIIMFGYQDDDHDSGSLKRELLLYGDETMCRDNAAEFLMTKDLDLRPIHVDDFAIRVFAQGNAKASRKQVAPLVGEFYQL